MIPGPPGIRYAPFMQHTPPVTCAKHERVPGWAPNRDDGVVTHETTRRTGNASILEGNSFKAADAAALAPRARTLVERRQSRLGSAYRLFYREPVELVRGSGAHAWDADGTEYLDLYNNVPSLGHAHPAVVAAVQKQM